MLVCLLITVTITQGFQRFCMQTPRPYLSTQGTQAAFIMQGKLSVSLDLPLTIGIENPQVSGYWAFTSLFVTAGMCQF